MASGNFECGICFDTAQSPVTTQCGHLYCWQCLQTWMEQNRATLTCPVCKSGISRETIIPLYNRSEENADPTRPRAQHTAPTSNQNYSRGQGFMDSMGQMFNSQQPNQPVAANPNDVLSKVIIIMGIAVLLLVFLNA